MSFASWIGSASMSARRPMLRAAVADAQPPDDAGAADAAMHLAAEGGKLLGHQRRRALLLEAQFGMGVDVAPPGGEVVVELP